MVNQPSQFSFSRRRSPDNQAQSIAAAVAAARSARTAIVFAYDEGSEGRDRGINEPVQFYTSKGGRLPYELVVNTVNKDQIVGYLSTPKETVPR